MSAITTPKCDACGKTAENEKAAIRWYTHALKRGFETWSVSGVVHGCTPTCMIALLQKSITELETQTGTGADKTVRTGAYR